MENFIQNEKKSRNLPVLKNLQKVTNINKSEFKNIFFKSQADANTHTVSHWRQGRFWAQSLTPVVWYLLPLFLPSPPYPKIFLSGSDLELICEQWKFLHHF